MSGLIPGVCGSIDAVSHNELVQVLAAAVNGKRREQAGTAAGLTRPASTALHRSMPAAPALEDEALACMDEIAAVNAGVEAEAQLPVQNHRHGTRFAKRAPAAPTLSVACGGGSGNARASRDRGDAKRRRCKPPASTVNHARLLPASQPAPAAQLSALRGVDKSNRILHELIALARNEGHTGPLSAVELAAAARAMVKSLPSNAPASSPPDKDPKQGAHKGRGGSSSSSSSSSSNNTAGLIWKITPLRQPGGPPHSAQEPQLLQCTPSETDLLAMYDELGAKRRQWNPFSQPLWESPANFAAAFGPQNGGAGVYVGDAVMVQPQPTALDASDRQVSLGDLSAMFSAGKTGEVPCLPTLHEDDEFTDEAAPCF